MGAGMGQPPVQQAEQSVVGAVLDMFNVLHEPTAVFSRIKQRARIIVPWLVFSVFSMAFAYLTRPFQHAAMEALRASLPPEQAARMNSGDSIWGLLVVPVILLLGLAVGAGLLALGVAMTGAQARYKTLMSVLAYSCSTYVLFSVVTLAVLMTRGAGQVVDFTDLRAPIGLDVLVPGAGLYLGAVLNAINPFSIWGVWLAGTGLAVTHGISRATGIVVTAFAFVICVAIQSAPLIFLSMAIKR
jgi:Yip1-like protein